MKLRNVIIFVIFTLSLFSRLYAENNYKVHLNPTGETVKNNISDDSEETLFILDYSNSMNEYINEKTKYDMLLSSLKLILTKISFKNKTGVRLYGQRWGLTPLDACKATKLIVPIGVNSPETIFTSLSKYSPKGMTPITYSLKQALLKDFTHDMSIKKHIILITDGGENCDESPCKYAMELVKYRKDVTIDVIAFNIFDSEDLDQLECVAKVTKGKFYNAETQAELVRSINHAFKPKKSVDAKIIK